MKVLLSLCVILLASSSSAIGQDGQFTPMKGTAAPSFQMSEANGRCLVFGTHIVKTTLSDDGGENVNIWDREGKSAGAKACEVKLNPYITINDADNNSFYGISADYFFIDTGTSAGSRTLFVYNTDSGYQITKVDYQNEPSLVTGRYLMYDEPSNKKGPISTCPQAAKWKRDGGSVGWVQGKKMDLKTETKTNVGTLRCVYME